MKHGEQKRTIEAFLDAEVAGGDQLVGLQPPVTVRNVMKDARWAAIITSRRGSASTMALERPFLTDPFYTLFWT
jgi:hypothetical protein